MIEDNLKIVKLTAQAVVVLGEALSAPNWTKSRRDLWAAGELLQNPSFVFQPNTPRDEPRTLSMNTRQHEVAKAAMEHLLDQGGVRPSPALNECMKAFDLIPKDN